MLIYFTGDCIYSNLHNIFSAKQREAM